MLNKWAARSSVQMNQWQNKEPSNPERRQKKFETLKLIKFFDIEAAQWILCSIITALPAQYPEATTNWYAGLIKQSIELSLDDALELRSMTLLFVVHTQVLYCFSL